MEQIPDISEEIEMAAEEATLPDSIPETRKEVNRLLHGLSAAAILNFFIALSVVNIDKEQSSLVIKVYAILSYLGYFSGIVYPLYAWSERQPVTSAEETKDSTIDES